MTRVSQHTKPNPSAKNFEQLEDGSIVWTLGTFMVKLYTKHSGWIKTKGEKIYIYEWKEYRIRVYPENIFEHVHIFFGDDEAEIDEGFWKYTFRNYIGKSRFRVFYNNSLILDEDLEVISPKFIYMGNKEDIDNYIDFVKLITDELTKYVLVLPFHLKAPTEFQVEECYESINILFAYHFFKINWKRIITACENVLSRPHRRLEEFKEQVSLTEVTTVDDDLAVSIISESELWKKSKRLHPLTEKTRGFIPEKFYQWKKYETLDTQENRFVKYFLGKMSFWLEEVISWIEEVRDTPTFIEKMRDLQSFIETVLNSSVFSEVRDFKLFPYQSQILLKRDGYRDFLELWKLFNARIPIFNELSEAIANKSVDKLYEYWCFFELVNCIKNILGETGKLEIRCNDFGEITKGKAIAKFRSGLMLVYSKYFSRHNKESYSVPLRPDYALIGDKGVVAVFDAKFRFEDPLARLVSNTFEEYTKQVRNKDDNIGLSVKLDDIFKMHAYRDALKTKAAAILYPGNTNTFFAADGTVLRGDRDTVLRKMLEEILNCKRKGKENAGGVGFLSFFPRGV